MLYFTYIFSALVTRVNGLLKIDQNLINETCGSVKNIKMTSYLIVNHDNKLITSLFHKKSQYFCCLLKYLISFFYDRPYKITKMI